MLDRQTSKRYLTIVPKDATGSSVHFTTEVYNNRVWLCSDPSLAWAAVEVGRKIGDIPQLINWAAV